MKDEEIPLIELAFSKKKADERKEWLRSVKADTFLDHTTKSISYTDFVNKELILFSMADNIRSIPSVLDGFKPGQRKVMFACFKRNLKKDMKVAELAGLVSGMTAYHHGEVSLQQTIVGLAQTFVGSNNVNLLEPSGQFGTRNQGGGDSASARYIFTRLSPFARKLFHQADEPLLTYNVDDDKQIEPQIYAPILPMILVNGADGIGTGWSSSIPNYDPIKIVENLKRRMDGQEWEPMQPYFRGFRGEVKQVAPDRFQFSGIINQKGQSNEVEITELPIRVWTQDFKDRLEDIIKAEKTPSFIKDYKDYNTHDSVHFDIQMEEKHMAAALNEGLVEKFKLTKTLATSNLVAFDPEGRITKYANVEAILDEFFSYRLQLYAKRKEWLLNDMQEDLDRYNNQRRFIEMIIDGKLVVSKKKKAVLIAELKQLKFKAFAKVAQAAKAGEDVPVVEEEDDGDEPVTDASSYDYLLGMAIWSLTEERVAKLNRQIKEKEDEMKVLSLKTPQDLWRHDLDEFVTEWEFQLSDEKQRKKKIVKGRRDSRKFNLSAPAYSKTGGSKKRKGLGDYFDEDSDFDDYAPKAKKVAPAPKAAPASKQKLITKYATSPKIHIAPPPKPKLLMWVEDYKSQCTDGASDPLEAHEPKGVKPAKASKVNSVTNDSDFENHAPGGGNRQARAVTKKPTNYTLPSDDSDSDNGDGLLADLGDMVKGLPGNAATEANIETRALFSNSVSRPSSSHGYKPFPKPAVKPSMEMSDNDETDYKLLAPSQSPRRSILVTKKDDNLILNESEDEIIPTKAAKKAAAKKAVISDDDASEVEVVMPVKKPAIKKVKQIFSDASDSEVKPKPKKAALKKATKDDQPKAKKSAAKPTAAAKKSEQSPVAKAYAKRLAKKKTIVSDDEDEDALADDLLKSPTPSDPESAVKPAARPARRAVATKKAAVYDFGDDEDETGFQDDGSSAAFSDED
jgi:DNA topoisomerase II